MIDIVKLTHRGVCLTGDITCSNAYLAGSIASGAAAITQIRVRHLANYII